MWYLFSPTHSSNSVTMEEDRGLRPPPLRDWVIAGTDIARRNPHAVAAGFSYFTNLIYPNPPSSAESTDIVWADTPPSSLVTSQSSRTYPDPNPRARKRLRFESGDTILVSPTPSRSSRASSVTQLLSALSVSPPRPRSQTPSPDWLKFSHSPSPYNSEWGLSTQGRLSYRWNKRSQASQARHAFYLGRFRDRLALRAIVRVRARKRPRRHYLATAVRQASRRLLHRRKRYIFVRPSQRKKARLLVSSAKKALWKAKRAYRNASFSQA